MILYKSDAVLNGMDFRVHVWSLKNETKLAYSRFVTIAKSFIQMIYSKLKHKLKQLIQEMEIIPKHSNQLYHSLIF